LRARKKKLSGYYDDREPPEKAEVQPWLPKAKRREKVEFVEAWPFAEKTWLWTTCLTTALLLLCARSAVFDALPGVNAALGQKAQLSSQRVAMDALLFNRVTTVRRKSLALLGVLTSPIARKRFHEGAVVSTLSPLVSDLRLDGTRAATRQVYRKLTYAAAHSSLPHLAFDGFTTRRALVIPERLPTPVEDEELEEKKEHFVCGKRPSSLLFLYLFGSYAGAAFHLSKWNAATAKANYPVGGTAGIAALQGSRFISRYRLRYGRRRRVGYVETFRDMAIQIIGNRIFGVPVALTFAGFGAGLLYGVLCGPRFTLVAPEAKNFLLLGDARDARRKKRPRKFAPRTGPGSRLVPREPILAQFWLFLVLVVFTNGAFLRALGQTPNALRVIFFSKQPPGFLSDRLLRLPPTISFF